MALSDTCLDILDKLSFEFTNYSCFKYEAKDLIPIIDAMFNLAEFIAQQNGSPQSQNNEHSKIVDRYVIHYLLGGTNEKIAISNSVIHETLVKIFELSEIHPKLAKSLDSVYNEFKSGMNLPFHKMNSNIQNRLFEICQMTKKR